MAASLLLIVDPQIDFITGSLPVTGAAEAMNNLAQFISENGRDYDAIIITADWHPTEHLSFTENGGPWPRHCIAYSQGAAIWPPLFDAVLPFSNKLLVATKGTTLDVEEYSVFSNEESSGRIQEIVAKKNITQIDICGLAGDVCVAKTLSDGVALFGASIFRVLQPFSPSIDGGKKLHSIIIKFHLAALARII